MEIKDVILSTLKEIEESSDDNIVDTNSNNSNSSNMDMDMFDLNRRPNIPQTNHAEEMVTNTTEMSHNKETIDSTNSSNDDANSIPTHDISTEEFLSDTTKPTMLEPSMSTMHALAQSGSVKNTLEEEKMFLNSVRERVLVLFEGLQSPNNRNIEAKVDLIINFLEYQLAVIDERLEKIQKNILSM